MCSLVAGSALAACSSTAPPSSTESTGQAASALFANGGFEADAHDTAPSEWTVTTNLNDGVTLENPQTRAGLKLQDGGVAKTVVLKAPAGPGSEVDANLGEAASLRWPRFGNAVAVVNRLGKAKNANSLKQTMKVGPDDIDARDGLAHIRFALAPVLQDAGHNAHQQPYFFVQLRNLTQGNAILYQDFNFANQPGVPWKHVGSGDDTIRYTDWALVDIAPGSGKLAPGDEVELEIIAAGCQPNGHWGHVYVDGVGPTVPGLFVSATGPAAANEDTDITYVLTYSNGGADGAEGAVIRFQTPPGTTFTSVDAPPGVNCTPLAAGSAGEIKCTVGDVPAGEGGSFPITVHINPGTSPGTVTAGDYDIDATGGSPLLGPKVNTEVTEDVTYADLGVAIDGGASTTVPAGGTVTYVVTVTNKGPNDVNGATVKESVPPGLVDVEWTCVGTGGATCANGTDSFDDIANIPAGEKVPSTRSRRRTDLRRRRVRTCRRPPSRRRSCSPSRRRSRCRDACADANQCQSGACEDAICDALSPAGNGLACAVRAVNGPSEGAGAAAIGAMLAFAGLARRRKKQAGDAR